MLKISQYLIILLVIAPAIAFGKELRKVDLRNNISIAPISIFYGGVGAGLSYEHFISQDKKVSLYLPVSFGIRNYYVGQYQSNGLIISNLEEQNYSLLFAPGIKLYPAGQRKRFNYSIGSHLFVSTGTDNGFKQIGNNTYAEYSTVNDLRIGTTISNGFSFNISTKVNVGFETMLGCSFLQRINNKTTNQSYMQGVNAMGLFAFHIGYRF